LFERWEQTMLVIYDKNSKKIIPLSETNFSAHNILERRDIEKWIENCPDILGEELLIISTEYDRFDKTNERLDLLAIDKDGNLVVIELKRDDTGKYVDLQAIKYAAYCSNMTFSEVVKLYCNYLHKKGRSITEEKAKNEILEFIDNEDFEELSDKPRIIIASKEFRPEVTATVLWLRKFGVDIKCVKLTPYELDDKTVAIESTVLIPLPEAEDFIIQSEKKENVGLTITQQEYIDFYNELVSRLNAIIPRDYPKPGPRAYYSIPVGKGVHFEWAFHGRPRSSFGVELHFESGNKNWNIDTLKEIVKLKKAEIEQKTNEKVIVQENWGSNWTRMYIEKNEGKMTEDLKKWAVEKMKIFIEILQPEIEKLINK